jgi:hypothetical protein
LQEECDEEKNAIENGNWTCKHLIKKTATEVIKKEGKG